MSAIGVDFASRHMEGRLKSNADQLPALHRNVPKTFQVIWQRSFSFLRSRLRIGGSFDDRFVGGNDSVGVAGHLNPAHDPENAFYGDVAPG